MLIIGGSVLLLALLLTGLAGIFLFLHPAGQTSVTTQATPFPGTPPGETVLFQDLLTDNTKGWPTDHCFFKDHSYHLAVNGYGMLCLAPSGDMENGTLMVTAKQVSGVGGWFYGLYLRWGSTGGYQFAITNDGHWRFGKVVNSLWQPLTPDQSTSTAIKVGLNQPNILRVRATNAHFSLYINGIDVGQADDAAFATGRTGLWQSSGYGAPIEVAYSNFQISTAPH